ncbi:MAG TPA: methyltransferase domain-containing protein [Gammaproteobacteria bacterium]|nr:methyltransferase domain-containing protein [Gammaproteobacteria bacterium]
MSARSGAARGVAFALPEKRAARRGFDAAAATFDDARFVHDETRARLLARLDLVRLAPRTVVDLGCATGRGARALAERYPGARVVAVDSSARMLRAARGPDAPFEAIGGDAEQLPLRDGAAQLVLANLTLPWCDPRALFAQAARVLAPGGLLLFATLGPDSLQEVRRAWSGIDAQIHVHAAVDMHDLGDLALAAGLAEPVIDVDRLEVTYARLDDLIRDLRACGAMNVAAGRRRGLTGGNRWRAFERRLHEQRRDGRFAVTMELVLGQAWGAGAASKRGGAPGEVAVPVERIRRRT